MKKKVIAIITFIVICAALIFQCNTLGFLEKEGSIEKTVKTVVRAQYGWGNIDDIRNLCTDEGKENIDFESLDEGVRLYTIDDSYKENIKDNSESMILYVQVYSPNILVHVISLERTNDGKYEISNIEMDI